MRTGKATTFGVVGLPNTTTVVIHDVRLAEAHPPTKKANSKIKTKDSGADGADGTHRPDTGAERFQEPMGLVGETKVGLAQLEQQLH